MGDERLRRLERKKNATDAKEDEERYKREVIRSCMGDFEEYTGQKVSLLINSDARLWHSSEVNTSSDLLIEATIVGETPTFLKLEDILMTQYPLKIRSGEDTIYKRAQINLKYIIGVFQYRPTED